MWHGDIKCTNAVENGADWLARCKVAYRPLICEKHNIIQATIKKNTKHNKACVAKYHEIVLLKIWYNDL